MPVNDFSTGKDVSLTINLPSGPFTLSGLTDLSMKPVYTDLKSKRINGDTVHAHIPDGWQGTIKRDRIDGTWDAFFAALEAAYYANTSIGEGTVKETIKERDGTVSQFRYERVVLKYDDPGSWSGDRKVEQTLTVSASRKTRVT